MSLRNNHTKKIESKLLKILEVRSREDLIEEWLALNPKDLQILTKQEQGNNHQSYHNIRFWKRRMPSGISTIRINCRLFNPKTKV